MSLPILTLIPISDLNLVQRNGASQFIFDALPEYYMLFNQPKQKLLGAISKLLEDSSSDISNGVTVLDNGRVGGICTWLLLENLQKAQLHSLTYICSAFSIDLREMNLKLKSYILEIEPIHNIQAIYLSRIAIATEYMGTGLSERLMREFMKDATPGKVGILHVEKENNRAIIFYKKMGFDFLSSEPYSYRQMITSFGNANVTVE